MAKIVRISNDGGTSWANLPGSDADFNSNADGINDTVFGQTLGSQEVGLQEWKITSNGIFKGFAGYVAELKKVGTPVTAAGEAMTIVSGQVYSIDDITKEVWDRSVTPVITDGVTDVSDEVEFIDYLFGQITFVSTYSVVGAITIDIDYMPMEAIGKGNGYQLTMGADVRDESYFEGVQANGFYKINTPGLRSVALSIDGIFDSSEAAVSDLAARNELIIEIDAAGDGSSIARGFFKYSQVNQGGAVGAIESEKMDFELTVPFDVQIANVFGWRHTATTLALAVQYAITSWETELDSYDAQYLPAGAEGESPLDGKEGNVVFSDISLSGGLNSMNTFNIEMVGNGALTVV